jgi:hypothetical protein
MTNIISLITPHNILEEKEKFFASSNYNPTFQYRWQQEQVAPIFQSPLKQQLWKAISVQDHQEITRVAGKLFEVSLDDQIIKQASHDAVQKGKIAEGSANELAALFTQALQEFEIDYQVKIVNKPGFNVRPKHESRKILISEYVHFEYFSMEAEVHHEMVHIIRSENGRFNAISRNLNYLPTEEGLASWCQDHTNDDNSFAQHAMEYVATSIAVEGSLRDVYNCFRELGASPELAWKRASRHKFGFVETKKSGDIMKPAMYYYNEQKIANLSKEARLRLFVGKISLNEIPNHPQYVGHWSQKKIESYFHL